jgi:GTP-binding protein YchF
MQLGLVGLPNSGKTTLFNALTRAGAPAEPYPFTTIEPNIGVAIVPDEKLARIAELTECNEVIPAHIKVVDIAGLVEGASEGAGLGNRFLAHIREMDAILILLSCFAQPATPVLDLELLQTELALADLETARKRVEKLSKETKGHKEESSTHKHAVLLEKICRELNRGKGVHQQGLGDEELDCLAELFLLTAKPRLLVANLAPEEIAEKDLPALAELQKYLESAGETAFPLSALLEEEVAKLDKPSADELLETYGLKEPQVGGLIKAGFELLNLVTFYTTQGGIAQSWSVERGTEVQKAGAKIHSDLEEGFIKAEVVSSDELLALGSMSAMRSAGKLKIEGPHYQITGGEVVKILHR